MHSTPSALYPLSALRTPHRPRVILTLHYTTLSTHQVRSLIDPALIATYDAEERRVADQPDDDERGQGPTADWCGMFSSGTLPLPLPLPLPLTLNPNPNPNPDHPNPTHPSATLTTLTEA